MLAALNHGNPHSLGRCTHVRPDPTSVIPPLAPYPHYRGLAVLAPRSTSGNLDANTECSCTTHVHTIRQRPPRAPTSRSWVGVDRDTDGGAALCFCRRGGPGRAGVSRNEDADTSALRRFRPPSHLFSSKRCTARHRGEQWQELRSDFPAGSNGGDLSWCPYVCARSTPQISAECRTQRTGGYWVKGGRTS